MSNRRDIQFFYTPHNRATLLDCNFVVASTDAGGLGVTGLNQGGRIATVFMHTTASVGTAPNGQVNPNPAAGLIQVTLQDNYNKFLNLESSYYSPVTGAAINVSGVGALTVGVVYVITSLGSTTAAQWYALGIPANLVPAVGMSFIAAATTGAGSGQVKAVAAAGIDHIELVGNPAIMNSAYPQAGTGNGMVIQLACYKNGVLTAPADGTQINLAFYLNNSAQGV
jgi:hypothetical protein